MSQLGVQHETTNNLQTPSRGNTIKLDEHQIENLKNLIVDKIGKMFQNFDEEKKDNLIKNLPNFLILIVNNGKNQSEIVELLEPVLGEAYVGEFVFWFFETIVNSTHTEYKKPTKVDNSSTPIVAPTFTSNSDRYATNMANHLVHKFSVRHNESGQIDYNDNIVISESQLIKFNKFHELDSILFPQYVTTSQMNSIKFSSDPELFLGTSCFVVEDGLEPLDTSELIEISFSNPQLKRRPGSPEESLAKKIKQ